jgi:hypothetical protein
MAEGGGEGDWFDGRVSAKWPVGWAARLPTRIQQTTGGTGNSPTELALVERVGGQAAHPTGHAM